MNTFDLHDNHIIAKTFEKGANACLTEESCFAVLTSTLSTTRTLSAVVSKQMESDTSIDKDVDSNAIKDISDSDKQNKDLSGGIFNNECIPCGLRINFEEELNLKKIVSDIGKQVVAALKARLTQALAQIKQIIEMFSLSNSYIDLCSLMKFLNDFICIPDLRRMIAALMALLMDISFELNGILDLILSLIMPLFLPFLTTLMDMLQKYILMVLKPIECIIDSIQNMLSKLDYNVLFQNLERLDVSLGPKVGKPSASASLPILGSLIPSAEVQNPAFPDNRDRGLEFSLTPAQKAIYLQQQAEVDQAAKELDALRKASANVNAADPAAYKNYKDKETAAREKYREKLQNRDMSQIGQLNKELEQFQTGIKSAFFQLISFLREACQKFDALIASLFDEFKKLLGEYIGGSGIFIDFAGKKLAILQLIAFINTIIMTIANGGLNCDTEDKQIETFTNLLAQDKDFIVSTTSDGGIEITRSGTGISDAIDIVAKSRSKSNITGQTPVQKINSLVELTGDPVIDQDIIQSIDKFVTGDKSILRCSKQPSKDDAEQVNRWIEEIENDG